MGGRPVDLHAELCLTRCDCDCEVTRKPPPPALRKSTSDRLTEEEIDLIRQISRASRTPFMSLASFPEPELACDTSAATCR
jgi:hypothetical protein